MGSKIQTLIDELCPNGVEYRRLGNLVGIRKGRQLNKTLLLKQDDPEALFPVMNGSVRPIGWWKEANAERGAVTVNQGGSAGFVDYMTSDFWASAHCFYIPKSDAIDDRFLYHTLKQKEKLLVDSTFGATIPTLRLETLANLNIPIPPLPVQEEIARILDTFAELTAELTVELTAELAKRKQQYQYYSKRIFEQFNANCFVSLRELGKWTGGKTPSMDNASFWNDGTIPWISSKDMKSSKLADTENHITDVALEEAGMKLLPADIIAIVTRSGILKHTLPVSYVPFETTINQDIKALIPNKCHSSKYIFFALKAYSNDIRVSTKKIGGTVDSLEFQKILDFKIPVPPLEEQQRIVSILDRFDALCSSLTSGIPAEIEMRKKQYEYYRNKLLTFKRLEPEQAVDSPVDA